MGACGWRTPGSQARQAASSTRKARTRSRPRSRSFSPSRPRAVPRRSSDVIDPATRIGAVHLTIGDLDRSIRFYETHLGLTLRHREGRTARLGAGGPDLLVLSENPGAPRVRGTTGLYHFAILVPSRP